MYQSHILDVLGNNRPHLTNPTRVHIFVAKWCIVGYGTGAVWHLCNRSIGNVIMRTIVTKRLCLAGDGFTPHTISNGKRKVILDMMASHISLHTSVVGFTKEVNPRSVKLLLNYSGDQGVANLWLHPQQR